MGICIVEIRESSDVDTHKIAMGIYGEEYQTNDDLVKGLKKSGLAENRLFLVRVYELDDFIDMCNSGEPFDSLAKVNLGFRPPISGKVIKFV